MQKSFNEIAKHGVFLDVDGVGVLLSGQSGVGKSELALGLISRGHRLVADDSVILTVDSNQLVGRCPDLLQDFLEVRGLGILNIRAMFGDTSIKEEKLLQLIINIIQVDQEELYLIDRLYGMHDIRHILDVPVPEVSIPVAPGRNLAILVEAAVKNHLLKITGYHASEDFTQRHQKFMRREQNDK
jgi:HPr kinase/phosphorylase